MAVRLIHQHNLLEATPTVVHLDLVSELVDNVLDMCITMLEFDPTWLISVADVVGSIFEVWDPHPDSVTRRRVYHRVRYRLEACVTRGLLKKSHSKGYVLRHGANLDDFGFKRV
jgi:hypothetical protein